MTAQRMNRLAACMLTALAMAAAISPALVSAISLPPTPPPPGWTLAGPLSPYGDEELYAFTGRSDGSRQVIAAAQRDAVTYGYNLSLFLRSAYGFSRYPLLTEVVSFTGLYLASTDQPDRITVFSTLTTPAGPRGVYVSFLAQGSGPQVPVLVSDTAAIQSTRLAATPQGNVMVAWLTYNGTYAIYANHSAQGAGFDGSVPVIEGQTGVGNYELAAVDEDTFLLAWTQWDGLLTHVWASVFTNASGWSTPTEVVTPAALVLGLAVAGSPTAKRGAVVAWAGDGLNATLWLTAYTTPDWQAPEAVANFTGPGVHAYTSKVSVDDSGNTHMFWGTAPDKSVLVDLHYARMDGGRVWGDQWHHQASSLGEMQLATAADGGAALTWTEADSIGHRRPSVARLVPGSGWRAPENFDTLYSPTHAVYTVITHLAPGGNFTAAWQNLDNNEWTLLYREFIAGNSPPPLSITAPVEGAVTAEPSAVVEGTTAPGATVVVGGVQAAVASDGSFSVRVALEPGTHVIEVFAVDEWGNSGQASVTVTFEDPVPHLLEDLNDAEANLTQAQAEIQAAHELTHTVQQQAVAAEGRAANLSEQLNQTKFIVQHMQSDLDFLTAQANNKTATTDEARVVAAQSAAGTATAIAVIGVLAGLAGVAMSLMRRGGGGGGGGGGDSRIGERPTQAAQAAEPAGTGGPTHEPPPPPRPGIAPGGATGESTSSVKQTMQTQV